MDLPIVYIRECLCFDGVGALGSVYVICHNGCCRRVDILIDQFDAEGLRVRSIDIAFLLADELVSVSENSAAYVTACHLIVRGRSGSIFSPIRGEVTVRPDLTVRLIYIPHRQISIPATVVARATKEIMLTRILIGLCENQYQVK